MPTHTPTKPARRPRIISNLRAAGKKMDVVALREYAKKNPEKFALRTEELIESGDLRLDKIRNLEALFTALADVDVRTHIDVFGQTRAIQTSAFPLLMGNMTVAALNEAYEGLPTVGDQLVREIEDTKKVTILAATTTHDSQIDEVAEGKDFPPIEAGEEKYEIGHKRNGRRLSITQETIDENDVAGFVDQINALAEISSEYVEELTLRRICDVDGSSASPKKPYALQKDGAGISLYQTDNDPLSRLPSGGNRITNNALVDETDLSAARARLAEMTNGNGKRINIPINRCTLLVPNALEATALKILGSEMTPGTENELNNWGPRGSFRPKLVSTPKLDDLSTTAWYLGLFEKQFIRKWKIRMEYVTLAGGTQEFLKSRIAFQARIAWDCEVGARDYVYVIQNLGATTAPGD